MAETTKKNGHSLLIGLCIAVAVGFVLVVYLVKSMSSDVAEVKNGYDGLKASSGRAETAAGVAQKKSTILETTINDELLPKVASLDGRVGKIEGQVHQNGEKLDALINGQGQVVAAGKGPCESIVGCGKVCPDGTTGYRTYEDLPNGKRHYFIRCAKPRRKKPGRPPTPTPPKPSGRMELDVDTWAYDDDSSWQGYDSQRM